MKLPLTEIVIPERIRRDAPVDDLVESFKLFGQLQPIIVSGNTLVAGYRRYCAAKALGWTEIEAIQLGDLPRERQLELELEENMTRKQLSWQEQALAVLALHRAKVQPQRATARLLGISEAKLSHILRVAEELEKPGSDVWKCTSFLDAVRHVLGKAQMLARRELMEREASLLLFKGQPPRTCTWAFTWGAPFTEWPRCPVIWHTGPVKSVWPFHHDHMVGWLHSPEEPAGTSQYSSVIPAPSLERFYHSLLTFLNVKQVYDAAKDDAFRAASSLAGIPYEVVV